MFSEVDIPPPFLFNPLKHHLGFIRSYINSCQEISVHNRKSLISDLKHLGTSLMDIYLGDLSQVEIIEEARSYLERNGIIEVSNFSKWAGINSSDFKTISLSDGSEWILKYFESRDRYVHYFPSRNRGHALRVKANTVKSAILYLTCVDKDFITRDDLNRARAYMGLSPVREVYDVESITGLIEIIRA